MQYTLCNRYNEVCDFILESNDRITEITQLKNVEYAPLDILKNNSINLNFLNLWLHSRGIPVERDNYFELMKSLNVDSAFEFVKKGLALSLSDQYWIKPSDLDISWDKINYFQNDFDGYEFAQATFGDESPSLLNIKKVSSSIFQTPNGTAGGMLKKIWYQENGDNHLLKAANTIHRLEPINEVLATKVCEILDVEHVSYSLKFAEGKRTQTLVSDCLCAISDNEEMILAYAILINSGYELTMSVSDYYTYVKVLKEHGLTGFEESLEKMFMLDYILLNEDRHLSNFGVIRDVKTLEWKKLIPIFDTGRSMNTNITQSYWDFEIGEVKCFTNQFINADELLPLFTYSITKQQIEQLHTLPSFYESLLKCYSEVLSLSQNKINMLVEGLQTRIKKFEKEMSQKNLILDMNEK